MKLAVLLLLTQALAPQTLPWVDLSGPWKVQESDDPGFAQPGFDDSSWPSVRLPNSFEFQRTQGRYFWLRRTLDLPGTFGDQPLTLTVGKLTENYELFVNGRPLARVGEFDRAHSQLARPRSFDLPRGTTGELTIALRLWVHPYLGANVWRASSDPGPYLITAVANAPRSAGQAFLRNLQHDYLPDAFLGAALLTLMLILLLIFLSRRTRPELFWLALYCGGIAWRRLSVVLLLEPNTTPWTMPWGQGALNNAVLAEFFLAAYGVRSGPLRLGAWALALSVFTPWGYAERNTFLTSASYYVAGLTLFYGLLRSVKRDAAGWLVAVVGILLLFVVPSDPLFLIRPIGIPFLSVRVNAQGLVAALFALVMVLVLTRRLLADQTEKQRLAGELEAARTVQSLLLMHSATTPGDYAIDAAYQPAQEVGGDFYYVLDGQLVLVGDVSGKGLKAAMLVSLMIGVLRETSHRRPASVIAALNRAVAGQIDAGFVTCFCAHLEPGGLVTIANAGQLPPYLDGRQLELPAGLPLGLDPGVEYEETSVTLAPGAKLAIVSDGVVEAENAQRELFGFDRTRDISTKSAQEIADAAKAWGQNDDITVVTVRRSA